MNAPPIYLVTERSKATLNDMRKRYEKPPTPEQFFQGLKPVIEELHRYFYPDK